MKDLTDKLEAGIKEVFSSDKYRIYLSVMSRFYNYSFRNSLLVMLQRPESTHVAGFTAWRDKFHRTVNKGERGIQILAPAPYRAKVEVERRDESGKLSKEEVEIIKPAFRAAYVFDVSQTSGEPLPELATELTGSVSRFQALFESLRSVSPFPIQMETLASGMKGYCDPANRKIAIHAGMSEAQTLKTAIHEITHADLHADPSRLALEPKDRQTKEVEAESVAYVVCSHYGIDTSEYSFAYLANWSSTKELKELKSSLEAIQVQAGDLIDRIDRKYLVLTQSQERENHDSIKFDMDIDLDKERTRTQLGFKDNQKVPTMAERMAAAKAKSTEANKVSKEKGVGLKKEVDREER